MRLLKGDCLDFLPLLGAESIDACVTDPPYGLTARRPGGRSDATKGAVMGGFMGMKWDSDVPSVEIWKEVYRVLKPGAHLLAFFGTRTYHRGVCAIEDAGFEIRDQVQWLYGSGFPKSLNIGKSIDAKKGWGTALKPAHEPIVVARKPLIGTVAENVLAHGVGGLNIDGCRVGETGARNNGRKADSDIYGKLGPMERVDYGVGRWPANIVHDGSDEVLAAFPDAPGQLADASRSSSRKTQNVYGDMKRGNGRDGEASADRRYTDEGGTNFAALPGQRRNDAGSAARFFYCAKANKKDRTPGNNHPTVKPTDLMRWLCRLVTPPGGAVLDPFMGSGSTGCATVSEGFDFIGIEKDDAYFAIAERRIAEASFL